MKDGWWCEWWAATMPGRGNQGSSSSPRRPNSFFSFPGLTVCVGTHERAAEVEGQRAGHLAVPWRPGQPLSVACRARWELTGGDRGTSTRAKLISSRGTLAMRGASGRGWEKAKREPLSGSFAGAAGGVGLPRASQLGQPAVEMRQLR